MDIFDDEVTTLLRAFDAASFRYILVGGFAVNMHGHRRATGDVDVWMDETPTNRKALREALRIAGYGDLEIMERLDFIPGWTAFRLNSGLELDIMTKLKGLEAFTYDEVYERAVVDIVYDVPVRYLHLDDLLRAKQASNRNKDLGDLDFLLGRTTS